MRRLLVLALGVVMVLVGLISVSPAQAVTAEGPGSGLSYGLKPDGTFVPLNAAAKARASAKAKQAGTCTWQPDGKCYWYHGVGQFYLRSICFQNSLGVYWNYLQAEQGFESGTATVKFYNHGPSTGTPTSCQASGGWALSQIVNYQAYGINDGGCARVTVPPSVGGYYNGPVLVEMNASPNRPAICTDTLQHRNNNVSEAIGFALGLDQFSSSTNLTSSVMNTYFSGSYNYPGVDDRNALYRLYRYNAF